jgi:excisionase family DNA binding protein
MESSHSRELAQHRAERQSAESGPARRLLTLPEASAYLGLSPWTVRELTWKGKLPVVRLTRKLLFDLRDLDRVIEASKDGAVDGE